MEDNFFHKIEKIYSQAIESPQNKRLDFIIDSDEFVVKFNIVVDSPIAVDASFY